MSVQTVGEMTSKHSTLEVSADQVDAYADVVNWTHLGGSANSVTPGGGEHMTGSSHTFTGHDPVIGIGKRNPITHTVRIVYTEEESEAADLIDGFYENQTKVWLRHKPGGDDGHGVFVVRGWFTGRVEPPTDATSGDILLVEVPFFGRAYPMVSQPT